jgi:hypothetical protein
MMIFTDLDDAMRLGGVIEVVAGVISWELETLPEVR